jgi:hypothetical protein
MFSIVQRTQFWYKQTMCLHVLHVSVYCGYRQIGRAYTIALLSICHTPLHWPVFIHWQCVVEVVYLMPL